MAPSVREEQQRRLKGCEPDLLDLLDLLEWGPAPPDLLRILPGMGLSCLYAVERQILCRKPSTEQKALPAPPSFTHPSLFILSIFLLWEIMWLFDLQRRTTVILQI